MNRYHAEPIPVSFDVTVIIRTLLGPYSSFWSAILHAPTALEACREQGTRKHPRPAHAPPNLGGNHHVARSAATATCVRRVPGNAIQKRYPTDRNVTIGLTRNLLVLVTVPTEDRVVSVARVDTHEYATDALIDQCESML